MRAIRFSAWLWLRREAGLIRVIRVTLGLSVGGRRMDEYNAFCLCLGELTGRAGGRAGDVSCHLINPNKGHPSPARIAHTRMRACTQTQLSQGRACVASRVGHACALIQSHTRAPRALTQMHRCAPMDTHAYAGRRSTL